MSTFPLVKCDDLLLFSVLYHLNWIPLGFGLLFSPNNQSENVTLGSGKLWLEVLTIFWHFNDDWIEFNDWFIKQEQSVLAAPNKDSVNVSKM